MTVIDLINETTGAELQSNVRQSITENNSVLAGCNVHWLFRASAVDLETGRHGLRWLIARILNEAGACHPKYNGNNGMRSIYVKTGLTVTEIINRVRSINGFDKYPNSTIEDTLYIVMQRAKQVDSVQLTATEDCNRTSKRPRRVWYLVS